MGHVEAARQRVRAGVRRPEHGPFDRRSGEKRPELHCFPGRGIRVAGDDPRERAAQERERPVAENERFVGSVGSHRGLHRVCDGVESGRGDHLPRGRREERRIQDHRPEHRGGRPTRKFLVVPVPRNQRIGLRFAAGPGGRRHPDQRGQGMGTLAVSAVVLHASAAGEEKRPPFGDIERAASAHPRECVGIHAPGRVGRARGIRLGRVLSEIRKRFRHDSGVPQALERLAGNSGGDDSGIGGDEDAAETEVAGGFTQFLETSDSGPDRR